MSGTHGEIFEDDDVCIFCHKDPCICKVTEDDYEYGDSLGFDNTEDEF